ncbi:MAG: type II secretion system minor pseudopilin GspJ [Pseudomonadota bacterium]
MSPQRGFSLLELLVAVAVFAVVSAVAYGGLSSVLQTRQQTDQHAKRLQALQQAMMMIQRDLSQAIDRPVRDQLGDLQPALVQEGAGNLLVFTRAGRVNPLGLPRSTLQRVGYSLDGEGRLVRYLWPVLDRTQGQEPYAVVLLDSVRGAKVRFVDSRKEWQESWPQGDESAPLPLAVEITLELDHWGGFQRLLPLVESAAEIERDDQEEQLE